MSNTHPHEAASGKEPALRCDLLITAHDGNIVNIAAICGHGDAAVQDKGQEALLAEVRRIVENELKQDAPDEETLKLEIRHNADTGQYGWGGDEYSGGFDVKLVHADESIAAD